MAYTTLAKCEKLLNVTIPNTYTATITTWIGWVTAYIDRYTKTTFESSADATYYYDSNGGRELFVDDLTAITSLCFLDENGNVDDTLTENTDFWLYPLNSNWKNEIRLDPWGSYPIFPSGSKRVRIIGRFAVSNTVPADIEWVATSMVADLYKYSMNKGQPIKSESLGEYSVTFGEVDQFMMPEYKKILDLYRVPTV